MENTEKLIRAFNALEIEDMPQVNELHELAGSYINLSFKLPSGRRTKLWRDDQTYLGTQLCKANSERCYGLAADEKYLMVCEYGEGGQEAEIVVFKRWNDNSEKALIKPKDSCITIHIYYTGQKGNAHKFAEEMMESGIVDQIRQEEGNLGYAYFMPAEDPETVLLIDSWKDQASIDAHHASGMMSQIIHLREKYDLQMKVERFFADEAGIPAHDQTFIRK